MKPHTHLSLFFARPALVTCGGLRGDIPTRSDPRETSQTAGVWDAGRLPAEQAAPAWRPFLHTLAPVTLEPLPEGTHLLPTRALCCSVAKLP